MKATKCPEEPVTGLKYDPRYTVFENEYSIGEWDMMKENNVDKMIQSSPSWLEAGRSLGFTI